MKKKEMFLLVFLAIIMLAEAIVERDIWRSGMIVR